MKLSTKLHNLAVMFRTNDPNIGSVTTHDTLGELDGPQAVSVCILVGAYLSLPKRHIKKRTSLANRIADRLDTIAQLES